MEAKPAFYTLRHMQVIAVMRTNVYTDVMEMPVTLTHSSFFRPRLLLFIAIALCLHAAVWSLLTTQNEDTALPVMTKNVKVRLAPAAPLPPQENKKPVSKLPHRPVVKPEIRRAAVVAPTAEVAGNITESELSGTAKAATDDAVAFLETMDVPAVNPQTATESNAPPENPSSGPIPISALQVQVPPSGLLKMKVVYVSPGKNPVYGIGEIQWTRQQDQYQMRVDASLDLLITSLRLYRSQSEGSIGPHGITPKIMSESRRGRSETATHFNYDSNTVSFSSSNKSELMSEGIQDRSTVFMQLAGLGIASPEQFQAGREIRIQVAEDRDANPFIFQITGQEDIDTKIGRLRTWHILRPPRAGFYNSTLELWLAPDYQWFPVQIRNTETNGAVTTQTVTEIQLASQEHP